MTTHSFNEVYIDSIQAEMSEAGMIPTVNLDVGTLVYTEQDQRNIYYISSAVRAISKNHLPVFKSAGLIYRHAEMIINNEKIFR